MKARFALVALVSLTTGCATVLSSKHHDFTFGSVPPGAQVFVDGTPVGTTPLVVNLSNTQAHTVLLRRQGYEDVGCQMQTGVGAGWVVADIVLGGLIALGIDAVSGDWSHTSPHECIKILQPIPGEPASVAIATPGELPLQAPNPVAKTTQLIVPVPRAATPRRQPNHGEEPGATGVDVADNPSGDRKVVVTPTPGVRASPGSPNGPVASEPIGAPRSDADESSARAAYLAGHNHLNRHEWQKAETLLREAIRLDGSKAAYHADLGDVLMVEERWAEAEAAYTAAVLLDVDNATYRERLKEARAH